ncbi:DUF475 domain-containing protein [Notoacmeibacter sp. MSK16QG-6]|uniref:DUF475 domain-containing protein n=1 Tax=Notoacmeibacter sp. MSK16QG-6 TaxID=2957982 RepID=UPI00209E7FD3|nr:DUF475 domain-containing protein [Notoacmeibacter sp. MSK16QG-6]MCP1200457.1 DUF475 domain-containing protein [Notoacmeibacter sp. MSK16QG-6]
MTRYFGTAIVITIMGLVACAALGMAQQGDMSGALRFALIGGVLIVLEISLSFDNAVVNAKKLSAMTPQWQRRFLTWGILIAVFGMRIVFPIAVVMIAAGIGPFEASRLAIVEPARYAQIMHDSHISISAFGGTYLMMVALSFFIDSDKSTDWIKWPEICLRSCSNFRGAEIAVVLIVALTFAHFQAAGHELEFLYAALAGLIAYLLVEALSHFLDRVESRASVAARSGLGAFLYLEVLDASFSFDGVIGAFALTNNIAVIAIGLGVGAFYVRSCTIMLVERKTLSQLCYLEHGAFYSVLVLATIMLLQSVMSVPEYVTGLLGVGFIAVATLSSLFALRETG